jgi:hypothetical protein
MQRPDRRAWRAGTVAAVDFLAGLVPSRFADAEITEPVVADWVTAVLAGGHARLLLLGPIFCGKSHHAYAAVRRLLLAGYQADQIAFHKALDLGRTYRPVLIDDGPPVIILDDVTIAVDINQGVSVPLVPDRPDVQAVMAVQDAAIADAARRLATRPNTSWIICASGIAQMNKTVGQDTTDVITTLADVVVLPERPRRQLDC